ncbi:mechanosensitive ion channel family protein [Rhizorhapis sp. SPR117]|uniref:mechanosensitive ion channel family protein n=1 Tax=Rhizorhapis sp. SPR117 TaxID=2912611 RepID=UPI001F008B79|nr:mechanosensitive ion channel [Rhizorhapis sp. SPR117]
MSLRPLFAGWGIDLPTGWDAIEVGTSAGIALLILLLSWFLARWARPRLYQLWLDKAGTHGEGLGNRIGPILRYGCASFFLALTANIWPWGNHAALLLGIILAITTAMLVLHVLRGLHMPGWVSIPVTLIVAIAIISNKVGGFFPLTDALERIGFDAGTRRFSLLSLLTLTVTAVALFAGVRLANRIIEHGISRMKDLDATQKLLGQKLAGITIIVIAFFVGIDIAGIDLTAFAVFSGAFGLAVGFGLQKTFGNLIAGIILLMDRSIKPGDVIVVGDSIGMVNKIGVRAVSIITRDGKEHLIPNENLMTQEVENWSYSDRNVRVRIPVGVSYSSDIKLAQKLMLQAASDSPRVLRSPKPNVWLSGFGDSSVDHEVLVWISDPESGIGGITSDVLTRLWGLFQEHGVEIPFPQRDIHVRSMPDNIVIERRTDMQDKPA